MENIQYKKVINSSTFSLLNIPDDKLDKKQPFDPYNWDNPDNCSDDEYMDDDDYDDFDN